VAKWLGRSSYLDDLASLDRGLYDGLTSRSSSQLQYKLISVLKSYPKPEDLSLNFTITEQGTSSYSNEIDYFSREMRMLMTEFGVARSIDLIPGGSDIAVTADNRQEYIQLVCKYKLDKQIAAQSRAFFHGLSDLIDSKCMSTSFLLLSHTKSSTQ
jgi:ubiquitin-protein ligase E3 C